MAIADHARDLEAPDGDGSCFHPLKAARRQDHALERLMVRLNDVVEIFRCPVIGILRQQTLLLQAPDYLGIGRQFVSRDRAWRIAAHHHDGFCA
jgi:hypothetical protein